MNQRFCGLCNVSIAGGCAHYWHGKAKELEAAREGLVAEVVSERRRADRMERERDEAREVAREIHHCWMVHDYKREAEIIREHGWLNDTQQIEVEEAELARKVLE